MIEIEVNKPIKTLSKKYKFKFSKIFEALGKSAVMLFDNKPASAVKEFLSIISGVEKESTKAEELAFWLIFKSIGNTSFTLFQEINPNFYSIEYISTVINNSTVKN